MVDRQGCERELGKALNRHIGYTTGAYDIYRIANVTKNFIDRPSVYELEIISILIKSDDITKAYAEGIIDFSVALGLVSRIGYPGASQRLTLTDLGRAYCGAILVNEPDFAKFLLIGAIVENDSDTYCLLLDIIESSAPVGASELNLAFRDRTGLLRKLRKEWLETEFPNTLLRERIERFIEWIPENKHIKNRKTDHSSDVFFIKEDYARHHVTPKKKWAESLGHLTESGNLTKEGLELVNKLRGGSSEYFWLGPELTCIRKLSIQYTPSGAYGSVWSLLLPEVAYTESYNMIEPKLTSFMTQAYPAMRLVQSNQASLEPVRLYLNYIQYTFGIRINEETFFRSLFFNHRNDFVPLSKLVGNFGFYQLRHHNV